MVMIQKNKTKKQTQRLPRYFWEVRSVNGIIKLVYVDHIQDLINHPFRVKKAWEKSKDFPKNRHCQF